MIPGMAAYCDWSRSPSGDQNHSRTGLIGRPNTFNSKPSLPCMKILLENGRCIRR
ncbi:hypothetical protein BDFB_000436 [Asbolus verrucosus]|uniref:Uncharacterized protein n=1 Tax=Asbolus verrucosus TaxID=1661398 RepID=A0A482VLU2_ASBVE|nr:hypothetical protein BDFB_000436 [Asbolus verrucosus]